MAPVLKRRRMASTGSTSSSGTGVAAKLNASSARSVARWVSRSWTSAAYCW